MQCEIAGCEEEATHHINGIGNACKYCALEICEDLKLDEQEDVRRI